MVGFDRPPGAYVDTRRGSDLSRRLGSIAADAPRNTELDTPPSMDIPLGEHPHFRRGLDGIYRCTLCEQPLYTVRDVTAHYAGPSHEANVKAKRPMDHSWGVATIDRGIPAAVACPARSEQIAKSSTANITTEPEREGAAMGRRKKQ